MADENANVRPEVNPFGDVGKDVNDPWLKFEEFKTQAREALGSALNNSQRKAVMRVAQHQISMIQFDARQEEDWDLQNSTKSFMKDLRTASYSAGKSR